MFIEILFFLNSLKGMRASDRGRLMRGEDEIVSKNAKFCFVEMYA